MFLVITACVLCSRAQVTCLDSLSVDHHRPLPEDYACTVHGMFLFCFVFQHVQIYSILPLKQSLETGESLLTNCKLSRKGHLKKVKSFQFPHRDFPTQYNNVGTYTYMVVTVIQLMSSGKPCGQAFYNDKQKFPIGKQLLSVLEPLHFTEKEPFAGKQ